MQYCKNCGRQLKDGVRFCDRCGKSVRQSRESENSKKQKQIEKLQKERLERKRRQEEREIIDKKRKERRRQQRAKHSKIFIAAFAIIAAIAVIAIISFSITLKVSEDAVWKTSAVDENANSTSVPTMQPSTTSAPVSPVAPGENDAMNATANKDDYKVLKLSNGMEIPYPEVFDKEETSGNEELNLTDDFGGGATMVVCSDEYPGGTPSELMKEFASDADGEIVYSLAGSDWYGITVDNKGEISHRKYIIDRDSDSVVYYDFVYDDDSDYAEDYEGYIEYIDEKFDY